MVNASQHSLSVQLREPPSPNPSRWMRGRAIGTKRKVPECAIKLRETYGATRAYTATSKVESFFYIKYAVTCQTSKISCCGNIARIPDLVYVCVHPSPSRSSRRGGCNLFLSFPFAVSILNSRALSHVSPRSRTYTDKELSADPSLSQIPGNFAYR